MMGAVMALPMPTTPNILERTLAAATRDRQMATPDGRSVQTLIEGVRVRPLPVHAMRGAA